MAVVRALLSDRSIGAQAACSGALKNGHLCSEKICVKPHSMKRTPIPDDHFDVRISAFNVRSMLSAQRFLSGHSARHVPSPIRISCKLFTRLTIIHTTQIYAICPSASYFITSPDWMDSSNQLIQFDKRGFLNTVNILGKGYRNQVMELIRICRIFSISRCGEKIFKQDAELSE
jgi:hypothetical protein